MANTGRLIEMVEIDILVDGQWSMDDNENAELQLLFFCNKYLIIKYFTALCFFVDYALNSFISFDCHLPTVDFLLSLRHLFSKP